VWGGLSGGGLCDQVKSHALDPLTIARVAFCLPQINIYERAHENDEADALHAIAARKFGSSKTVRRGSGRWYVCSRG